MQQQDQWFGVDAKGNPRTSWRTELIPILWLCPIPSLLAEAGGAVLSDCGQVVFHLFQLILQ